MTADVALMDKTFHFIISRFVETGHAPHYTEVAAHLGVTVEEGRHVVRDVMNTGYPCWLHPGTDYIASFAPFSNLSTQYRVTVDGQQKWFAQCGFEALSMCWVFPGRDVRVDAPCLDCNEPMRIVMRDGAILDMDPPGIVGHLNRAWVSKPEDRPFG